MKRWIALLLALVLSVALCGCDGKAVKVFSFSGEYLTEQQLSNHTFYYYNKLSETEKQAYGSIYNEIFDHPEKIRIPQLDDEQLNRVFQSLSYDNPELLCLANTCRAISAGGRCYFVPDYVCTADECSNMTAQTRQKADEILSGIRSDMSDYEKELYFHDELFRICDYDNSGEILRDSYTVYGALVKGSAVCEGYSRAMQYLLDRVGIRNYLITGKAKNSDGSVEGHMWNIVTIDNKNYHVDATWDDPTGISEKTPSHAYFNVTDEMISRNHYDFEPQNPGCTSMENNYHYKNGLYFKEYGDSVMNDMVNGVSEAVKRGDDAAELIFKDKSSYDKAVKDLFDNKKIYRLFERANVVLGSKQLKTHSVQYHENPDMYVLYLTLK